MKISLGADERPPVVNHIRTWLEDQGYQVVWHGPEAGATDPWPDRKSVV